jgi:PAS domain-containing protein
MATSPDDGKIDFSKFDDRSLAAVALNKGDQFSEHEVAQAAAEVKARNRDSVSSAYKSTQGLGQLGLRQEPDHPVRRHERRGAPGRRLDPGALRQDGRDAEPLDKLASLFNSDGSVNTGGTSLRLRRARYPGRQPGLRLDPATGRRGRARQPPRPGDVHGRAPTSLAPGARSGPRRAASRWTAPSTSPPPGQVARFRAFLGDAQRRVYCDTTISPMRDRTGAVIRLLACARDVTEEVETQGFLKTVIQLLPSPLTVKNVEDGRYVLINRAAEDAFGLVADEAVGKTAREVLPRRDRPTLIDIEARVLRTGEMQVAEEGIGRGRRRRPALLPDQDPGHL